MPYIAQTTSGFSKKAIRDVPVDWSVLDMWSKQKAVKLKFNMYNLL